MRNKIDELREQLHKKLESRKASREEILIISEKLDKLIIEYYKNKD